MSRRELLTCSAFRNTSPADDSRYRMFLKKAIYKMFSEGMPVEIIVSRLKIPTEIVYQLLAQLVMDKMIDKRQVVGGKRERDIREAFFRIPKRNSYCAEIFDDLQGTVSRGEIMFVMLLLQYEKQQESKVCCSAEIEIEI